MDSPALQGTNPPRSGLLPALLFILLAVGLTAPLSFHPSGLARMDGDGRFSVWNIGWVAHALTTHPTEVWNANIFFPNKMTLAYSEANLLTGALAAPVYVATGSAVAAHNAVLVLSFFLSAVSMYGLVAYLTRHRGGATIAAISFAFCPFVFAHLSHIQLLMTAGLPLSLLSFHKMADSPTAWRGVLLGLVMAAQTYACAYYGVFVVLLVGFASLFTSAVRRDLAQLDYWRAVAVAALVAVACVMPLALVYVNFAGQTGFERPLDQARLNSATPGSYLASAAYAHAWLLAYAGRWKEVLFPGFVAVGLGAAGAVIGLRATGRLREIAVLYLTIAAVAMWASFGPDAGLYRALHIAVPGFSMMRAPSRFGLIVQLALSVLSGVAVAHVLARSRRPSAWFAALLCFAVVESAKPLKFGEVPPVDPVYRSLAALPDGGVIELPVYSRRFAFLRTQYMFASTAHWKPLVGGYSDYIPGSFSQREGMLAEFPSRDSLDRLTQDGVRYAVIHTADYPADAREGLEARVREFGSELRLLEGRGETHLYEIVPRVDARPTDGR